MLFSVKRALKVTFVKKKIQVREYECKCLSNWQQMSR